MGLTRSKCGAAGVLARLLAEDWHAMTAAARNSPDHVASLDRWRKQAAESNPHLDPDQLERLAGKLRRAHYVRMGKLSGQARKAARQAAPSPPATRGERGGGAEDPLRDQVTGEGARDGSR